MNNQFTGPTARDEYLTALEGATPLIEAVAVTDYYVTDTYEEVLRRKAAGRLPDAKLTFPNVELRLDVATAKGGFVNLHLFVSPEDPNHLEELQRLLSRLQFNVMQDRFDCTRADLTEHRGRIVKTTGDGILVEFVSVVDAVRCAVDIQRGMGERNAGVPSDERIEFRIGINVGDIIFDGDDIFGTVSMWRRVWRRWPIPAASWFRASCMIKYAISSALILRTWENRRSRTSYVRSAFIAFIWPSKLRHANRRLPLARWSGRPPIGRPSPCFRSSI